MSNQPVELSKFSWLKLLANTLLIASLIGASTIGCSTPITNKAPHSTYTATILGIKQTITFSGDTITRYDDLGGKAILKYHYTDEPSPTSLLEYEEPIHQLPALTEISASEAVAIWIQDITIGTWTRVPFKYMPDQDIVVFGTIAYYK